MFGRLPGPQSQMCVAGDSPSSTRVRLISCSAKNASDSAISACISFAWGPPLGTWRLTGSPGTSCGGTVLSSR